MCEVAVTSVGHSLAFIRVGRCVHIQRLNCVLAVRPDLINQRVGGCNGALCSIERIPNPHRRQHQAAIDAERRVVTRDLCVAPSPVLEVLEVVHTLA